MDETKRLAARYPLGTEVRNTLTGRHAWVVGVEFSPRDGVQVVQVDYRDGSEPAASSAEFTVPVTGPRSEVRTAMHLQPGSATSRVQVRTWTRMLRGIPHSFTAVLMPDGERRYFVDRYNGYCDDGTAQSRATSMPFDCAWSRVAGWTVKPTPEPAPVPAAELSESSNRGRPVVDVSAPSPEVVSGAFETHHDGPGVSTAYGVIVYRAYPFGENDYKITTCSSAQYRDEVLVPFYGYYDSTTHIDRFGPDLRIACSRCGDRFAGGMFGEFTGTECVDNQDECGTYGPHTP